MMNIKIPKPIPRGCPSGPVFPLLFVLTSRLLSSVEATEPQSRVGFNFARVVG
jgi:hypothetical protein